MSGWTQPSTDSGVASIQAYIRRKVEAKEGDERRIDTGREGWKQGPFPLRPRATFDPKKRYTWVLDTSEGRLLVELRASSAPEHVSQVIYLTLLGYYDGMAFTSIVPGKGAIGGERSPGYVLTGPELDPAAKHDRGGLLSAVSYGPGTDDAKFRLTFAADPSLDEFGTIYGEVAQGQEVLQAIEARGSPAGTPTKPVVIEAASIVVR